jgi:hypothetical protein
VFFAEIDESRREEALARLDEIMAQARERAEKLREVMKEDDAEYELVGTIDGTYAGRWMLAALAENASSVWPDGTAVYVKAKK